MKVIKLQLLAQTLSKSFVRTKFLKQLLLTFELYFPPCLAFDKLSESFLEM